MIQVRETIAHLFSLGRFEGVSVDATMENGGVALRYELIPIHPVARIRFEGPLGVPGIDQGELRRAIVDRYGVSPPLATRRGHDADSRRRAARARLPQRRRSRRSPVLEHDPERATLVFTIEPGPRTTIGDVEIVGVPTVSRGEFARPPRRRARRAVPARGAERPHREVHRRAPQQGLLRGEDPAGGAALGRPARRRPDADRPARDRTSASSSPAIRCRPTGGPSWCRWSAKDRSTRICSRTRATGSRNTCARRGIATRGRRTRARRRNGELVITFAVTRGQQFKVASYEISGNASVPLAEFESSLRLRDGQPFAATALDADVQAIEDLYHRRGFAAARVSTAVEIVTQTPPPAQVPVAVRAVINEGPSTTVDAVIVRGQSGARRERAARAPDAAPGRAVRAGTARRGSRRDSAGVSGSRLRERVGRGDAGFSAERHARRRSRSRSARGRGCSSTTC